MVYIVNDGRKVIACRCGNNNLLSARRKMSGSFLFGGIEACTLQYNVYIQVAPGKLSCVSFCVNGDFLSVYGNVILSGLYFVCIFVFALCGVIL